MLNEIGLLEKIESVCTKPSIFVGLETFEEVAEYLEMCGKYFITGEFYYHSVFTPFLQWYRTKYEKNITINLKEFQREFPSDDEALRKLTILYTEYVNDCSKSPVPETVNYPNSARPRCRFSLSVVSLFCYPLNFELLERWESIKQF